MVGNLHNDLYFFSPCVYDCNVLCHESHILIYCLILIFENKKSTDLGKTRVGNKEFLYSRNKPENMPFLNQIMHSFLSSSKQMKPIIDYGTKHYTPNAHFTPKHINRFHLQFSTKESKLQHFLLWYKHQLAIHNTYNP